MESAKEKFATAGLQVVVVGLGKPKHAQLHCGRRAPSVTCFVDHHAEVYRQYGLEQSSLRQFLSPGLAKASVRAIAGGHSQGKATGDVKMLPGTFVVDVHGRVQWAYYSEHAGDHPDIDEVIRAAASLT